MEWDEKTQRRTGLLLLNEAKQKMRGRRSESLKSSFQFPEARLLPQSQNPLQLLDRCISYLLKLVGRVEFPCLANKWVLTNTLASQHHARLILSIHLYFPTENSLSTEMAMRLFLTVQTPGASSILTDPQSLQRGPGICITLPMPSLQRGVTWSPWLATGIEALWRIHCGWVPRFRWADAGHERMKTRSARALKLLFL